MNIKSINYTEFKKTIKDKIPATPVLVNPYFNLENYYAKTVYIVKGITEPMFVTYRGAKNRITLLVPYIDGKTIKETLEPHFEALQRIINVACPVMSIFTTKGEKIAEISEKTA